MFSALNTFYITINSEFCLQSHLTFLLCDKSWAIFNLKFVIAADKFKGMFKSTVT